MSKLGNLRMEDRAEDGKDELVRRIARTKNVEERISVLPPYPQNMMLEVTSVCNHNCIFCANSKSKIKAFIDREIAEKCLIEAFQLGVREVGLFSRGEPLLDKNIVDYVELANKIGYEYIYITTNGALLSPQLARNLIDAGLDSIKFSINAGTPKGYQFIHGSDDFENVYNNICYLREYIQSVGSSCRVYVSSVLCKYTYGDQGLIREKFGEIVDEIEFFNVVNQGGTMPENIDLAIDDTDVSGTGNSICLMPFNRFIVTAEGLVDLCCVDYYNYLVVGNLKNNTLSEIWGSDRFREARERFVNRDYGNMICRNCLKCSTAPVVPISSEYSSQDDIYSISKKEEVKRRLNEIQSKMV